MTFTEAAAEVLRLAGKPMHYKEITELAIEKNLLSHVGKSPEVTMGARLAALLKKEDKTQPIVRVKPGVFALREWSDKKGKRGRETEAEKDEAEVNEEVDTAIEVNALEVEAVTRDQQPDTPRDVLPAEDDDDQPILTGDDALRADLAASGAELFDDEEDDDQPIFAAPQQQAGGQQPAAMGQAGDTGEGGRRRRRRRRRGRGGQQGEFGGERGERASSPRLEGAPIQPNAIISVEGDSAVDVTRDPLAPAPRPMIRDRQQIMAGGSPTGIDVPMGEGDELAGRELADAALMVLASFDRNAGPVAVRTLTDALMRRGRLAGDPAQASVQLSASLRADNLRRTGLALRPRFRFANGGRVAPTDWLLGGDLARLEQEVVAAVERYRDASRRAMLRRVQELPGHAFVELALVALERAGMTGVRAVRRAGSPGGEVHFAGVHKTGSDEIRTALVIRKDGRELGRERVTDLRGALHHYGPASAGWLVTTGQVLSGARDEAAMVGAAPIALFDGVAFCKLLEDHDVGVLRTRFPIAIPDLELFDALRG
jgi:hypothetical protein